LLLIAGYELQHAQRIVQLETARGPVEAYVLVVKRLVALGVEKIEFEICAYDFLSNRIFTEIDGVLGLDFLRGHRLTLDFRNFELQID
jgi:hypothetical protein